MQVHSQAQRAQPTVGYQERLNELRNLLWWQALRNLGAPVHPTAAAPHPELPGETRTAS